MWRRAHGRLAAIVAVAVALSSCAPTTAPPPKRVKRMSWGEPPYEEPCGGDGGDERPPTPDQVRDDLAAMIEVEAARCQPGARAAGRSGEVDVIVAPGGGGRPRVLALPGRGLAEEDRRCVESGARAAVAGEPRHKRRMWGDDPARDGVQLTGQELRVHVALGTPPPLFESTAKLTAQWLAAKRSKPAARRFAARLPSGVTLDADGCLSMPARKAFNERVARWLAKEAPVHPFWQGPVTEVLATLTSGGGSERRAYWMGDDDLLLHRVFAGDSPRQQICLVPLDDRVKRELQARVDERGSCWIGDLDDILVQPRTEFPSGRRFTTVSAAPNRACALDDGGALVCCGERLPAAPPAAALSSVAVGTVFDCGIAEGGGLLCWGADPPAGGRVIPGPYRKVVVGGRQTCAIRRDTGALECWRPDDARMTREVRDHVRDVTVSDESLCALLEDGRIFCRAPRSDPWRELAGPFRALAASPWMVCGVTASSRPGLRCWQNRDGWPDVPETDLPLFATIEEASEVAVSGSDGCVLTRSGQVACWPEHRNRLSGLYRAIAGGEARFCAITAGGGVECDRPWPAYERQWP